EMTGYGWRALVRYVAAEPAWWSDTARAAFPAGATPPRMNRLFDALGLQVAMLDRPLALTSTGERQRMALARALVDEPRVLLIDEPTAALDPGNAALVEELIRYQILSGRVVVLVSHDGGIIGRLATVRLELARPLPDGRHADLAPRSPIDGRAA
ncbi:MAG: ATP-binding cassette domain-containing protein, partial [Hyphomicrobium sp.]